MILICKRDARTRHVFRCSLYERDPFEGDCLWTTVTESVDNPMPELFYRVTVTASGICLNGKPAPWKWMDRKKKEELEKYICFVLAEREEVLLEITHPVPDYPGYPRINHNAYVKRSPCYLVLKVDDENFNEDG